MDVPRPAVPAWCRAEGHRLVDLTAGMIGTPADRPALAEAWKADATMSSTPVGEDAHRSGPDRGRATRLVVGPRLVVTGYRALAIE